MWVNVTDSDIAEGDKAFDACPITVALRKKFGNKLSVSRDFIRVSKKNARKHKWLLIKLPTIAKNFLLNSNLYNNGRAFKFQLSAADAKLLKDNA
jgi:hypothetical protein